MEFVELVKENQELREELSSNNEYIIKLENKIKKLEKDNLKLKKSVDKYSVYDADLFMIKDFSKLREESNKLRAEMFQIRETIRSEKKQLSSVKTELRNYNKKLESINV